MDRRRERRGAGAREVGRRGAGARPAVSSGAPSRHHWGMPSDAESTGRRRARRPRRRRSALLVIVLAGLAAVVAAFALASALDDDRPHGPYLIGAWTFGDRPSLDAAVKAGAIDEVSADWLQSRADGSVTAPRLDTDFIAEAKRKDCRVFVTLTDYDETQHTFDPAISAAILATPELAPPARRGGRRLVQGLRRGRRRRGLGGRQGLAERRVLGVRRGAGGSDSTPTTASSPSTSTPS